MVTNRAFRVPGGVNSCWNQSKQRFRYAPLDEQLNLFQQAGLLRFVGALSWRA